MMISIYKEKNRNNIGSQSEIPILKKNNNFLIIDGYQNFKISSSNIIYFSKIGKYDIIKNLLVKYSKKCNSIIDIGCSNGLVSFLANNNNYNVYALDHDIECINVILKIINELSLKNIKVDNYSFGLPIQFKGDIVIMLALIHWIFSCTSLYGNFDDIFKYIYPYINKYLWIEWITPNDNAIKQFNHINFNKKIHTVEYSKDNFEKSIVKNIGTIKEKIEIEGPTRILYIIKKNHYNNI